MKKYRSHKLVEAGKIKAIEELGDDGLGTTETCLLLDDGWHVAVSDAYMAKHNPQIGGYYVRYADGYESWSPAKAFEEGYAEVVDVPFKGAVT